MELLVEIDDVVLLFVVGGFGGRDENAGNSDDIDDLRVDDVHEVVVDDVVDNDVIVLDEVLFEDVLVDVVLFERGLVLEVVVTHFRCLLAGGGIGERACNRRAATILPTHVAPVGGAEYNAARKGFGDHRSAFVGAREDWLKRMGGPVGRPLGPLGGPACARQAGYRSVL